MSLAFGSARLLTARIERRIGWDVLWASVLGLAVAGGCTTKVQLLNKYTVPDVASLQVVMEPPLANLEERMRDGGFTVIVPTGELLQYYFMGVTPGTKPPATLHLVDSHLDWDSSGAKTAGALGLLGAPLYLSMVDGYVCKYSVLVEAVTPDGTRHLIAGHGDAHGSVNDQQILRDCVRGAANNLHDLVAALLAPPAPATTGAEP